MSERGRESGRERGRERGRDEEGLPRFAPVDDENENLAVQLDLNTMFEAIVQCRITENKVVSTFKKLL